VHSTVEAMADSKTADVVSPIAFLLVEGSKVVKERERRVASWKATGEGLGDGRATSVDWDGEREE